MAAGRPRRACLSPSCLRQLALQPTSRRGCSTHPSCRPRPPSCCGARRCRRPTARGPRPAQRPPDRWLQRRRHVSCGGEHTLFLSAAGRLLSAGACGLGWHGQLADAQSQATLDRRASPCALARCFGQGVLQDALGQVQLFTSRCPSVFLWLSSPQAARGGCFGSGFGCTQACIFGAWLGY